MMFRRGNRFHQRAEFDAVLQPDLRGGDFPGGGLEPGGVLQFVPGKNGFQRDRRLRALMGHDVRVQRGNDLVRGAGLVA